MCTLIINDKDMKENFKNTKEFQYIVKVMNLKGDTEDKKHGYYKVLKFGDFILKWDSRNSSYYLNHITGSVDINDYLNIAYKQCLELYKLPSSKPEKCLWEFIDKLYLKNPEIKAIYDSLKD